MTWLGEITLKQLLFFLLTMGKFAEILNMRVGIDMMHNGTEITDDAFKLYQEFSEANRQKNFDRITEIVRQTFVATP